MQLPAQYEERLAEYSEQSRINLEIMPEAPGGSKHSTFITP